MSAPEEIGKRLKGTMHVLRMTRAPVCPIARAQAFSHHGLQHDPKRNGIDAVGLHDRLRQIVVEQFVQSRIVATQRQSHQIAPS
ncbi:MAG TPA: hypothetical protein VL402_09600 [Xanthobacteraceae bacterium]|jgi:hypothetical protein|nr:hypothetical protein [Xanthobacteraceae bacterium]